MIREFEYLWQYLGHWANVDPAIKFKNKEISYGNLKGESKQACSITFETQS